ncbi:MAG: LamG-like jellyroll fold domain-containing protein [Leptospiraceae bacterium]
MEGVGWSTKGTGILYGILLISFCLISCVEDFPESPLESDAALLLANPNGVADSFFARSPDSFADLAIWFKADDLGLTDGDPVITWSDASGLGNDAFSGVAVQQPLFLESSLNGLPALQFDGTDDEMQSTDIEFDSHTIIVVARFTNPFPGSDYRMNLLSKHHNFPNHSTALYFNWRNSGLSYASFRNSVDGTTEFFSGGPANQNEWYVVSGTFNGIVSSLFLNGELSDVSDLNSGDINNTSFPFYIARNANTLAHRFKGEIAEIIMYSEHLSDQSRVEIECYLSLKYNLSLPHNCI